VIGQALRHAGKDTFGVYLTTVYHARSGRTHAPQIDEQRI